MDPKNIHHVRTDQNPADCCSRGLPADKLVTCDIFYKGPEFLQHDTLPTSTDEDISSHCLITHNINEQKEDLFKRISNWNRLVMVVAWMMLWKAITKQKHLLRRPSIEHITEAKAKIFRYYQQLELGTKFKGIKEHKWLTQLTPFEDSQGVLRAGGRLENSDLRYDHKHPIILLGRIKEMIIRFTHQINMHAGNSTTQRFLQEQYYISGIKNQIFNVIKRCVLCTRYKNKRIQPLMGQLPDVRVTQSHTFKNVEVDLAGPFLIKAGFLRTSREMKVWIAVFVCMFTKAAHFEIVTSLSTNDFLQAFERFRNRRGQPRTIWCDNATNFVGAQNLLKSTWHDIFKEAQEHHLLNEIQFRRIPKHSPSFGGIWEALVKSLKYFLKRMGNIKNLTYDEFATLLTKIEYIVNSRPLTTNPISIDEDPALTANHFLTQRGLQMTSIEAVKGFNIFTSLWRRYSTEVFASLQRKFTWHSTASKQLNIDDIVVVSEPQGTPGEWKLGKVVRLFPDALVLYVKWRFSFEEKRNFMQSNP